jgi:hypothetical protein
MRPAILLLLAAFPCFPQTSDSKTLESLLTEVRELRLAIERSTLLGARTQLAVSQLQLNEAAVARIGQELAAVRTQAPGSTAVAKTAENVKQLETWLQSPDYADPRKHQDLEGMIRQRKLDLDQLTAQEQQRAARESELALQLQRAQNDVADARNRITQMEQALDAAIQQLLKPH